MAAAGDDSADDRPRLGDGRLHQVASGQVRGLQGVGVDARLDRVRGEQEARRLERLPHPAGGVEPRGDGERHRLEVDRIGLDAGPLEEGRDAGPRRAAQPFEPETRDRPVLPDDRGHVGDRSDRRQVGQVEGGQRTAGLVREQELGDLEGHAAPRQAAVRVGRVGPMGVDHGEGGGHDRRHAVVVGDDDVDPAGVGRGDLGDARRAAVDRHDDRAATRRGRIERRQRQAVALVEPARHVRLDRDAEAAQGQGHDREPGQAVGIEVAEDEDALAAVARGGQAGQRQAGIGQQRRIVEAVERIREPGHDLVGRHGPAGGQDARHPGRDAVGLGRIDGRSGMGSRRPGRSSGSAVRPWRQDAMAGCTADLPAGFVSCLRTPGAARACCAARSAGRDGGRPTAASRPAAARRRRSTSTSPR